MQRPDPWLDIDLPEWSLLLLSLILSLALLLGSGLLATVI